MSKIESYRSSVILPKAPYLATPAFANTTSSFSFSRLICAKRRSRSARLDTSPCTPVTFLPISFTAAPQLRLPPARDEDVCAFIHKLLRGRKANTAIAPGNECGLSFQLFHGFLLPLIKGCQIFRMTLPEGRPSTR